MTDLDYTALDPGIRRTVRWLRSLGYETTDSGDGKKVGMECARDHAHVTIRLELLHPGNLTYYAGRLRGELRTQGITVVPIGHKGGAWIRASYDSATEVALLEVMHLDDSMLPPGLGEP